MSSEGQQSSLDQLQQCYKKNKSVLSQIVSQNNILNKNSLSEENKLSDQLKILFNKQRGDFLDRLAIQNGILETRKKKSDDERRSYEDEYEIMKEDLEMMIK